MQNTVSLFFSLILVFFVGAIRTFFTAGAVYTWYTPLIKPILTPPNSVYGPIWITLYILMAVSAWLIYEKRKEYPSSKKALAVYGLQLMLNGLWAILFFGFHLTLLSFFVILLLLGSIIATIVLFSRIDRVATLLLLPYVGWISFATYFNLMVVLLN